MSGVGNGGIGEKGAEKKARKPQITKLTPKQERFILEYLKCGNASEAYRLAYDAERMESVTVHQRAFDLLQNSKITVRINEIKAEAAKKVTLSVAAVLKDLMTIKSRAMEDGSPAIAIKALELLGKHLGMFKDTPDPEDSKAPEFIDPDPDV